MKLFTKGLLLIAVPSAVELALLGFVFGTQEEAMQAAKGAADSQQVLWQATTLAQPLLREAARVRTGVVLGDPSFIDRRAIWADFSDRLGQLEHLVANQPEQVARVHRMRAAAEAWRTEVSGVASALYEGRTIGPYADAQNDALPPQIQLVRTQLDDFITEERRRDSESRASLALTRTRQQAALIAAVVGSMLIWAGSAFVFARNIGRRLAVLTANAGRLGNSQPLTAPLSGNDEIAALDTVLHDTSARLRGAEREQTELKAQLEARAAELARLNEHLRQETQDNEMFIYSVSHDLRSPLVNLQGFSNELQVSCDDLRTTVETARLPAPEHERLAEVLDGDIRESLQFVRHAVNRAAAIIDALLRISRAGRVEYHWQRVSIGRVMARIVDGLEGTLAGRGVSIAVRELPPAWGDPAAIEQVFGQLTGNALRYLDPARPGRIEVGALDPEPEEPVDEHDPAAVPRPRMRTYYVRDNGVGIPAGSLPGMFRAFSRLRTDTAEGEGIGLVIVRRTVERHGGRAWVESVEGAGSTFFFTLPEQPLRAP
ncbi:sensor histidine kinase [Paraburkholderia kururiensis]|uniref:sensor histidine kinase n=1 Tax=Paraburkholderia kururiensis TaxID=984307 RepID=UPI00034ADE64|nr:sensor histidine kinase [Paraburkholderia kururiensis]